MKPFVTESVLQIIYRSNVHAVIGYSITSIIAIRYGTTQPSMLLLSWETEQNTELGGKNFNRDLTVMMFLQKIYCAITIGKRWKSVHGINNYYIKSKIGLHLNLYNICLTSPCSAKC
jgi:hypothetical protein